MYFKHLTLFLGNQDCVHSFSIFNGSLTTKCITELCMISIKMVEILQTIWTITLHGLEVKNCLLLFLLCIARMINGTVCIFSFELSGEILSP